MSSAPCFVTPQTICNAFRCRLECVCAEKRNPSHKTTKTEQTHRPAAKRFDLSACTFHDAALFCRSIMQCYAKLRANFGKTCFSDMGLERAKRERERETERKIQRVEQCNLHSLAHKTIARYNGSVWAVGNGGQRKDLIFRPFSPLLSNPPKYGKQSLHSRADASFR